MNKYPTFYGIKEIFSSGIWKILDNEYYVDKNRAVDRLFYLKESIPKRYLFVVEFKILSKEELLNS